jgi:hypothetical protein
MRGGKNFVDITGKKFGRLSVIGVHSKTKFGVLWECICECGNKRTNVGYRLRNGIVLSCGCLQKEIASKKFKKHGHSLTGATQSKEYKTWLDMRARCEKPTKKHYKNYGGRGISVCERWGKFENFLSDMGMKPSPFHTLDRINSDGNYEPSNCRWATRKEQNRNTRTNHMITYNGKTKSMAEWAELLQMNYNKLRSRIQRGWDIEKAFNA